MEELESAWQFQTAGLLRRRALCQEFVKEVHNQMLLNLNASFVQKGSTTLKKEELVQLVLRIFTPQRRGKSACHMTSSRMNQPIKCIHCTWWDLTSCACQELRSQSVSQVKRWSVPSISTGCLLKKKSLFSLCPTDFRWRLNAMSSIFLNIRNPSSQIDRMSTCFSTLRMRQSVSSLNSCTLILPSSVHSKSAISESKCHLALKFSQSPHFCFQTRT